MIGPNLSEWAIKSRQLTIYMMIVSIIAGTFAFLNLGRDEDPTFTIKTMLVTAVWPGATMEETQTQLTDRLERRLEETTGLDALRSITRPGIVTIYVDLDGQFPPDRVGDVWQEVRNSVGDIRHTLPPGVLGRSSPTISATSSASSTASPPTASTTANCATMSTWCARSCCGRSTAFPRSNGSAPRTSRSCWNSSQTAWRPWVSTMARSSTPSRRRTWSAPLA